MDSKKWAIEDVVKLFHKPLLELVFKAQSIHRVNFDPQEIQISTLLSIKTGGCAEDCKYCSQSARYKTGISAEKLLDFEEVLLSAKEAKNSGVSRFCMGAAWGTPNERDMPYLEKLVKGVKAIGLETCMTLGKLTQEQITRLEKAGLDYYSHNLDTSPEFYNSIVTTRSYQDRLETIKNVRKSGIKVCSGGILGLGESVSDRISLLLQLASLTPTPESIPINMLVKIPGTPFENNEPIDDFEYIRFIAITRIMMPTTYIRIGAGRDKMNDIMQAMCFMAGANSIFYGSKLLTTTNTEKSVDLQLLKKLGLKFSNLKSASNKKNSS